MPNKTMSTLNKEGEEIIPKKTRKCTKCHVRKYITKDFHKDSGRIYAYGYDYLCKKCSSSKDVRNMKKRLGYYTYKYRKGVIKNYEKKHKNRILARQKVFRSIKNGFLTKEPCEVCRKLPVQAHHHLGYAKKNWLNIKWLCRYHHNKIHNKKTYA